MYLENRTWWGSLNPPKKLPQILAEIGENPRKIRFRSKSMYLKRFFDPIQTRLSARLVQLETANLKALLYLIFI